MSLDFSVIIPTRNRAQLLQRTLCKLKDQTYPRKMFEILIVDDGSSDETLEVIENFAESLPIKFFHQPQGGASSARNRAILEARGLFCLFIDDDVLASPQLLELHRESHAAYLNKLVRGPVINFSVSPPGKPRHDLWRYFSMNYLCTSNASMRREWLLQAGLFDPAFLRWEDAELGVRLRRLGLRRVFNCQAYVDHWKPSCSLAEKERIAALDGRSAAQLLARYPGPRMYLRSGLHPLNIYKNRWLTLLPNLPGRLQEQLRVEWSYLQAGRAEMERTTH